MELIERLQTLKQHGIADEAIAAILNISRADVEALDRDPNAEVTPPTALPQTVTVAEDGSVTVDLGDDELQTDALTIITRALSSGGFQAYSADGSSSVSWSPETGLQVRTEDAARDGGTADPAFAVNAYGIVNFVSALPLDDVSHLANPGLHFWFDGGAGELHITARSGNDIYTATIPLTFSESV